MDCKSRGEITFLEVRVQLLTDSFQDNGLKEAARGLEHKPVDFPLHDRCHRVGANTPGFRRR